MPRASNISSFRACVLRMSETCALNPWWTRPPLVEWHEHVRHVARQGQNVVHHVVDDIAPRYADMLYGLARLLRFVWVAQTPSRTILVPK